MHADAPRATSGADWGAYVARLRAAGRLKAGAPSAAESARARRARCPGSRRSWAAASACASQPRRGAALLAGNPVYEAGGTVEIRELPRDW